MNPDSTAFFEAGQGDKNPEVIPSNTRALRVSDDLDY